MIQFAAHTTSPSPNRQADATDEQLLAAYCDRCDSAAFETLVHRYEKPVFTYLLRYMRSRPLAEEVLQGTFHRVSQKCDMFQPGRKVRPWMYSIATHLAVDALRRENRHHAVSLDAEHVVDDADAGKLLDLLQSATPSPIELAEQHERAQWTRRAVDQLDDNHRIPVLLVYFQGLKYREAAEILRVPVGTIKSRIHMALSSINRAWRRDHHRESP